LPAPSDKQAAAPAAPKAEKRKATNSARRGEEGATGGSGKVRASDPDNDDTPPPPDTGLMTGSNRKEIQTALDSLPKNLLAMDAGLKGEHRDGDLGEGHGTGMGIGDELGGTGTKHGSHGHGRGAGGSAEGEFTSGKGVDVKEHAPPGGTGGTGSGVKEAR